MSRKFSLLPLVAATVFSIIVPAVAQDSNSPGTLSDSSTTRYSASDTRDRTSSGLGWLGLLGLAGLIGLRKRAPNTERERVGTGTPSAYPAR